MKPFYAALIAVSSLSNVLDVSALEMTTVKANDTNSGIGMRLETLETAMTLAYNELVTNIATCSEQYKLYAPGKAGADADGCVTPPSSSLPVGTVSGFHLTACPSGWSRYTQADGRMLIGYGTADSRSYSTIGGTTDTAGQPGNAYTTLARANLPEHRHNFSDTFKDREPTFWDGAKNGAAYLSVQSNWKNIDRTVSGWTDYGQNLNSTPFNNRPPFTIVLWCKKD